jgi:hypothetical protein
LLLGTPQRREARKSLNQARTAAPGKPGFGLLGWLSLGKMAYKNRAPVGTAQIKRLRFVRK